MGLFDNIFLDQDTPTAMLDPLLSDDQKKDQQDQIARNKADAATKSQTAEKSAAGSVVTPSPDSFSGLMQTSTPETLVSVGADDDISFDIGGIDLPSFDGTADTPVWDSTGVFLSGGTAMSADAMGSGDIVMLSDTTDSSIALVQGATSATSDAIIESETVLAEEPIALSTEISTTVVPEVTVDTEVTPTEPDDSNILDMLAWDQGDSLSEITGSMTPDVPAIVEVSSETTMDDTLLGNIETPLIPVVSDIVKDEVHTPYTFSDTATDAASPLHDMLREFIAKLEQFKSESSIVDHEMVDTESLLNRERSELEEEYHTRARAIDYKEKRISERRLARQDEESRLEKIINTLKEEIA